MPPHLLTNFEKKTYDQNKPKYKGVIYSHIPYPSLPNTLKDVP